MDTMTSDLSGVPGYLDDLIVTGVYYDSLLLRVFVYVALCYLWLCTSTTLLLIYQSIVPLCYCVQYIKEVMPFR